MCKYIPKYWYNQINLILFFPLIVFPAKNRNTSKLRFSPKNAVVRAPNAAKPLDFFQESTIKNVAFFAQNDTFLLRFSTLSKQPCHIMPYLSPRRRLVVYQIIDCLVKLGGILFNIILTGFPIQIPGRPVLVCCLLDFFIQSSVRPWVLLPWNGFAWFTGV